MAWWIPLAMAAGGYVIDKQMGGDGTKGALLGAAGGAFMPAGAGLTSGAAVNTAGGTGATMTGFGGAGAISPYTGSGLLGNAGVNLGGGYTSGSLGGMTGFSPAVKAALPNAMPVAATGSYSPALTEVGGQGAPVNSLTNLFTQGKDYISEGFSDMTFADKLGVGMQAEGLLNRPTRRIQVDRPGVSQNKNIDYAKKYETVVDGIPVPEDEKITEEEYYSLLRNK
mgnify:FL=1